MDISEDILSSLRAYGDQPLELYSGSLRQAFTEYAPPYGAGWYGEKLRELARDPAWLARCLLLNAQVEGKGARTLWKFASVIADPAIAAQVKVHAVDESRHAKIYLRIIDTVFPSAIPDEARAAVETLSPGYRNDDEVPSLDAEDPDWTMDQIIQMNIGEIRTRINQLVMRPLLLTFCPEGERARLGKVLEALLGDETKHIHYTARLIEAYGRSGRESVVKRTTALRTKDFNEITLREVGDSSSDEAYAGC